MDNRIAEYRKLRGITQEELAGIVYVSRQTIISLENGKYIASLPLAHKLAQYFDTTIEELFLFHDPMDQAQKEDLK
ncbi:MAG: helix-turn-helix transcriptional regulator [bacterium]|nr:helix-turn-helix transcriptional regulator [bacterium]